MTTLVAPEAKIGKNVWLGSGVRILGPSVIGDDAIIDDNVVVGYPSIASLEHFREEGGAAAEDSWEAMSLSGTVIGPSAVIRSGTVIYEDVIVGSHLDAAHFSIVREGSRLGDHVEVGPHAYLKRRVVVGDYSRIANTLCDRTSVGAHCTVYGRTVHKFLVGVSGEIEPAPVLEDGVVIGRDACVVGDVRVGRLSLVGAGAIVTRSVADKTIVAGNPARFIRKRDWHEAPELWMKVEGSDAP